MSWDAALADVKAKEFQTELQETVQSLQDDGRVDALQILQHVQDLWQKYYRVTGHKRLARVFLKEVFE